MGSIRPSASKDGGVWGFLGFSHGWTWLFWGAAGSAAVLGGTTIWRPPALYCFVLGGLGVLLGGVVMTGRLHGAAGLRNLARRLVDPRPVRGRWWAVVLLFFPALTLLAAFLTAAIGAAAPPLDLAGAMARVADPASLAGLIAFTLLIGPLPEEIGWRGYLLDRIQVRHTALVASLLVGVANWVWHFPLYLLPGYSDAFSALPPTPVHLALVVLPAGVLYAWVYNNTGRSVLAVMLFHFTGNFSGEFLGISDEALMIRLVLALAAVLVIVRWFGPDTLRGDRPAAVVRERPGARWRLLASRSPGRSDPDAPLRDE